MQQKVVEWQWMGRITSADSDSHIIRRRHRWELGGTLSQIAPHIGPYRTFLPSYFCPHGALIVPTFFALLFCPLGPRLVY